MPTFCDIIGERNYVKKYRNPRLGRDDYFDGISFLPTLEGRDAEQKEHDYLYWEFNETNQIAVRQANWKLIVKKGISELYDLATDVHEDHNVAAEYPKKLAELQEIVRQAHIENPHFKVTLPK
jgi:arylsulfatase A-like enzyme